ncbi:DUF488 domain-containing protein [Flavobacteriaceae bacterium F89]|uniref:DUF488 domain-containing protein n=1 Tax=Cerina litoralis TaxID=2874477 RepID=A0AAE3JUM4_9FLAO|nr:DUF488 domain-containing protein [Cerina litoralis]MCG2462542.1 DUF488 domain-containing protein [Cerina litoralis]
MEQDQQEKTIWTIGHSTRTIEQFIGMLKYFSISLLIDIRRFPGSRKHPHFNRDNLQVSLRENEIDYMHFEALGGRRKISPDSTNTAWRNPSFKAYADYMETTIFKNSIAELEKVASQQHTAYMCSEAVWWRCHRSLVSDVLKARGWKVMHIMGPKKSDDHPYTGPAKIKSGQVSYKAE